MKQALHFGAGNIGRGFIGYLLSKSNYNVTFVDINETVINNLHNQKSYIVETVGKNSTVETITNVDGILSHNLSNYNNLINQASVVTISAGANILNVIAKSIVTIIQIRKQSNNLNILSIIACENKLQASSFLKTKVYELLSATEIEFAQQYTCFIDSAVDRIIPPSNNPNPTYVKVEEFYEWILDKSQIKQNLDITGAIIKDNLLAYVERKLFTLNTGHVATAYIAFYNNIATIDKAIMVADIKNLVINTMQESAEVLIKRYGFNKNDHYNYINKIIERFENPHIKDDSTRVGREVLRKLSVNERIVKPLLGCIEYNTSLNYLCKIFAYALCFNSTQDEESIKLQSIIQQHGSKQAINIVTQDKLNDSVVEKINNEYLQLQANK